MNLKYGFIPAVIVSVALAACAGPSGTAGDEGVATISDTTPSAQQAATADDESLSPEDAVREYNACVTAEGMPEMTISEDLGDGSGGLTVVGGEAIEEPSGDGFDESTFDFDRFEEVDEKCGHFLESAFGDFDLSPEQEAILKDAELEFTKCMKDQGFDVQMMGPGSDAPSIDPDEVGSPGDEGSSMMEFAEEDFEKFDEAAGTCEHVFEDAQKQLDTADGDR